MKWRAQTLGRPRGWAALVAGLLLLAGGSVALGQRATGAATDPVESGPAAEEASQVVDALAEPVPTPASETVLGEWIQFLAPRVLVLLIVAAVLIGIALAAQGRVIPIRDIPGLMVFDEAVARATEMGRPTLFTAGGASDLKRVQTFAAMPLLKQVASLSGELGNRLMVPVCFPETMPVHINAIKDGYSDVGAMDAFSGDDLRYFPGGQFFFAIASMGWMLEEQPAACFYFGHWEADSLLFAETGQTLNAMQIAGTDQLYQIPFFVAACDYTIIGEEFWAASAKMSQDPRLLGSVGAQDVFKISVLAFIFFGSLLCAWPGFLSGLNFVKAALKG